MKITYTQYNLAATYVKGELRGKVLIDFETALAGDKTLGEEVLFQRSILSALRLNVAADTLEQAIYENLLEDKTRHPEFEATQRSIQQARTDNINRQKRVRLWWGGALATAACVILVSIFGLRTYLSNQLEYDMANMTTTLEHKRTPLTEDITEVSVRRGIIEEKLRQAEQAFESRDWETTLAVFGQLRDQFKYNSIEMNLCEAIVFYNKKDYPKSIEILENIDLDEAKQACEIRYFLTLSYLKIKDKTKAKEQYKILAESSQNCARQDIKKLKKYFIL